MESKKRITRKVQSLEESTFWEWYRNHEFGTNLLLTLPIWEKTYFHIFLPITEQKEVDTELILHLLSGKQRNYHFKADFDSRKMTHFLLQTIKINQK
jgi:5-formyltetrahydrofolate cyclo-ligase